MANKRAPLVSAGARMATSDLQAFFPGFAACFTADVEQDCPPYLGTFRGMSEGMPRFLDLLAECGVRGTLFTTGEVARRFPAIIERVVADGHELACHGDRHLDFTRLSRAEAIDELRESLGTLRGFGPVVSFRAPYLRFPTEYLPLLAEFGLHIDSSVARYKLGRNHRLSAPRAPGPQSPEDTLAGKRSAGPRGRNGAGVSDADVMRIPASVTSSVLRLPRMLRSRWLARLKPPVVLFIHPWEAVDFRRSPLRLDCRFRTGADALRDWRDVIADLRQRGATFAPLREVALSTVP